MFFPFHYQYLWALLSFNLFFNTSHDAAIMKFLDYYFLFKDNLESRDCNPSKNIVSFVDYLGSSEFVSDLEMSKENLVEPSEISR